MSLVTSFLLVAFAPWIAGMYARRRKANLAVLSRIALRGHALVLGFIFIGCGYLPTTALANDTAAPRDPILNLIATALPPRSAISAEAAGAATSST